MLTHRIVIALLITLSSTSAIARLKIPFGEREVVKKVYDLPDTDEFKLKSGVYLDLATFHKEFNIAYILPLYVITEPKLVGYDKQSETYYDLTESEIDGILASQKLKKEDLNKLPFYTRYGGKLVLLLIIGLAVWGYLPSKKEKAVAA